MNYIYRLQYENAEQARAIWEARTMIAQFRAELLLSPKFQGVDTDGSRKDWIATGDVVRRLEKMVSVLHI